jgi:hypothetical protein
MSKDFKPFLFKLALLSIALLVIYGIMFNFYFKSYFLAIFPIILIYFFIITGGTFYSLLKANLLSHIRFINKYIAITTLRLLLNLFFIIAYLYFVKINPIGFVVTFLLIYLAYSFFEVFAILSVINKKKLKNL